VGVLTRWLHKGYTNSSCRASRYWKCGLVTRHQFLIVLTLAGLKERQVSWW
jgi:hypothetical protein